MLKYLSISMFLVLGLVLFFAAGPANAQLGNSGSIDGVVKDPSGGVVAGAKVEVSYPVSGFRRETTTDADGSFKFTNVPFNTYHLVVTSSGFAPYTRDVDVRSSVPASVQIALKLGAAETIITVEATGADLIEPDPSFHTNLNQILLTSLPPHTPSPSFNHP